MIRTSALFCLVAVSAGTALVSCQSAYYSTMEKFGYAKRDILVDRVEEGQRTQRATQEQVQTTYEAFVALTGFEGGDLEVFYKRLDREYQRCEARANDLRASVREIESVAVAMFSEWRSEAEQIGDAGMRQKSQQLLDETRGRYNGLVAVMQASVASLGPVLATFKDHVVFLKHNLNAQAIQSLDTTSLRLEGDVAELIRQMEQAIAEADQFLVSMQS
jgi:ElaB/YqjD/DUF883 family membrane-anchored ribosome-binding protein